MINAFYFVLWVGEFKFDHIFVNLKISAEFVPVVQSTENTFVNEEDTAPHLLHLVVKSHFTPWKGNFIVDFPHPYQT